MMPCRPLFYSPLKLQCYQKHEDVSCNLLLSMWVMTHSTGQLQGASVLARIPHQPSGSAGLAGLRNGFKPPARPAYLDR